MSTIALLNIKQTRVNIIYNKNYYASQVITLHKIFSSIFSQKLKPTLKLNFLLHFKLIFVVKINDLQKPYLQVFVYFYALSTTPHILYFFCFQFIIWSIKINIRPIKKQVNKLNTKNQLSQK